MDGMTQHNISHVYMEFLYNMLKQQLFAYIKFCTKLCLLCGMLFLSACSLKPSDILLTPANEAEALILWDQFVAPNQAPLAPYVINGSFRFGLPNETRRVTYIMWSNGDLPLRLDIQAGIGVGIASIEENENQVHVFLPQNERAYILASDALDSFLQRLGMSVPLSFMEISALMRGEFSTFFYSELQSISMNEKANTIEDRYVYVVDMPKMFLKISLNTKALPTYFEINEEWGIAIEYNEIDLPYKLTFNSLVSEYKGIMLVKEINNREAFSKEALELQIPSGTFIQHFVP